MQPVVKMFRSDPVVEFGGLHNIGAIGETLLAHGFHLDNTSGIPRSLFSLVCPSEKYIILRHTCSFPSVGYEMHSKTHVEFGGVNYMRSSQFDSFWTEPSIDVS